MVNITNIPVGRQNVLNFISREIAPYFKQLRNKTCLKVVILVVSSMSPITVMEKAWWTYMSGIEMLI